MSVALTAPYTTATGNGATTAFPFEFACRNAADVAVYINSVLQASGYTVALNPGFNGGTVTFSTAPANGAAIIIASNPSFMQLIGFENAGDYNPLTVDGAFDYAAIREIYLNGLLARTALVPIGEALGPLPAKTARAGLVFGFDANGNPIALNPGGADSALRTDLAGASGFLLVGGDWHPQLYPEGYGAVAGGVDTTAAINAAIAAAAADGRWLDGRGRTYGVTGKISIPSNLRMRDITFKQLAPGASASVITLEADTKDSVRLYRVKVNRNGDGTNGGFSNSAGVNGCLDTAFGIHINNCTNSDFDLLEVWGNDTGTGIRFDNCDGSNRVGERYVHDMTGIQTAGDGTDEAVCGVRDQNCTDIPFGRVRVINMQMTYGGVTDIWGTRGIASGGNQRCSWDRPFLKNVGEAFDASSTDDQADCVIVAGVIDTTYSWGFKLAHGCRRWRLQDCKTINTGDAGYVCSTGSNSAVTLQDRNVLESCDALNPGGPKAGYSAAPNGFEFHGSTEANIIGALARNCRAIDTNAVHTMVNGFYTDQTPSATNLVEAENCEAIGYTGSQSVGIHEPRIHLTIGADVSIPNFTGTETQVVWDTEVKDPSDLHSTTVNPALITIKRPGDYIVTAQASWQGNATGIRQISIQNNGVDITGASSVQSGQANDHTMIRTWPTIRLNAGDTLSMTVKQTAGVAINLKSANSLTNIVIQRIPA